jgi:hypothetical protein
MTKKTKRNEKAGKEAQKDRHLRCWRPKIVEVD